MFEDTSALLDSEDESDISDGNKKVGASFLHSA